MQRESRRHFGCPTLNGLELENLAPKETRYGHWKKKLIEVSNIHCRHAMEGYDSAKLLLNVLNMRDMKSLILPPPLPPFPHNMCYSNLKLLLTLLNDMVGIDLTVGACCRH